MFIGKPHKLGFPKLDDDHWAPVFKAAEERGLSVNFHTAFQEMTEEDFRGQLSRGVSRADYAKVSAFGMIGLAETVADVLLSDMCVKYPELKFVTVESGFGWLPYFVETLDWQWLNSGAGHANPGRELPSYYFRRQLMSTFWFERESISSMVADYADNVMFETDFPHPTSLSPARPHPRTSPGPWPPPRSQGYPLMSSGRSSMTMRPGFTTSKGPIIRTNTPGPGTAGSSPPLAGRFGPCLPTRIM